MALDSTGIRSSIIVECVFCPKQFEVQTYQPQYGHAGEEIRTQGPYFHFYRVGHPREEDLIRELGAGAWFSVVVKEGTISLEEFSLRLDGNPYAYHEAIVPTFGYGPGKAFWICGGCFILLESNLEKVSEAFMRKFSWYREVEKSHKRIERRFKKSISLAATL